MTAWILKDDDGGNNGDNQNDGDDGDEDVIRNDCWWIITKKNTADEKEMKGESTNAKTIVFQWVKFDTEAVVPTVIKMSHLKSSENGDEMAGEKETFPIRRQWRIIKGREMVAIYWIMTRQ